MVNNVSEKVSPAQIVEMALEPCKICKPANINSLSNATNNKAKGKSETVQCKGFTKKGLRCKHMTSIANGYCFQHNPE